eukprot:11181495-Lingulodinium_polyedra.AAC.1
MPLPPVSAPALTYDGGAPTAQGCAIVHRAPRPDRRPRPLSIDWPSLFGRVAAFARRPRVSPASRLRGLVVVRAAR